MRDSFVTFELESVKHPLLCVFLCVPSHQPELIYCNPELIVTLHPLIIMSSYPHSRSCLSLLVTESEWRQSLWLRDQANGFGRGTFGHSRDRLLLRRQTAFSRIPKDLPRSLSGWVFYEEHEVKRLVWGDRKVITSIYKNSLYRFADGHTLVLSRLFNDQKKGGLLVINDAYCSSYLAVAMKLIDMHYVSYSLPYCCSWVNR